MKTNCTNCLYTSERVSIFDDYEMIYKCEHENSPYYNNTVNDKMSCKFYIDYEKYILLKDRKENLNKIQKR